MVIIEHQETYLSMLRTNRIDNGEPTGVWLIIEWCVYKMSAHTKDTSFGICDIQILSWLSSTDVIMKRDK